MKALRPTAALATLLALASSGCGARTLGLYDFGAGASDASRDADAAGDEGVDTAFDEGIDVPVFDSGFDASPDAAFDTAPDVLGDAHDGFTVGQVCTRDGDCVGGGANPPQCSASLLPVYPTSVCVESGCDAGDGSTAVACGDGTGWCLPTGQGNPGLCVPSCGFDANGHWTSQCAGKDACNLYTYQLDPSGQAMGLGICLGGCTRDSDCPGARCQTETGYCTSSWAQYTMPIGATCTSADYAAERCNCLYWAGGPTTTTGYCSQACRMGAAGACPSGYACDAFLPQLDAVTGTPLFASAPAGLQGYCLKICNADADCSAFGGYCNQNAGTGQKTCQLGPRP